MSFSVRIMVLLRLAKNSWAKVLHFFGRNNESSLEDPTDQLAPTVVQDIQVEDTGPPENAEVFEDVEPLEGAEVFEDVEPLEDMEMVDQELPVAGLQGGAQNVVSSLMKSMHGFDMF